MRFYVGDIACHDIQNGCCGIGHLQGGCCSIHFECRGIQRLTDAIACIASARTLQNYHLILEKAFKMIPLGKVSYKGLVSVKNNKPTSLCTHKFRVEIKTRKFGVKEFKKNEFSC